MPFLFEKNIFKVFKIIIFFLLFIFSPLSTYAANLSISPSTGNFEVGDHISVKVMVTANNVLFNAVSAVLTIPSSILKVESVSKSNSVLNFWVTEPAVTSNVVKFEGVALGGFTGYTGTVVTINLRAIAEGTGSISFNSGKILANDGQGTDITSNLVNATFSVKEKVSKPEQPEQKSTTPKETPKPVQPTTEPLQPAPSLKAPEIRLSKKYGDQAITGISDYPQADTLVTFTSENGGRIFILGESDEQGKFTLLVPHSLKQGVYTVSAVMIKEDKTNSEPSNSIVVKVGNIFSDLDWKISLLILLLILVITYLILRIHMHINKNGDKNIKNEVNEAKEIIHKSFDILREDIVDYDNKKLPIAEHRRMKDIKKDISDAEKVISKKIKDIGSE
ncbi:MAG: cohesin domain-containing protein [Patescibacteria group bacterium]